MSERTRLPAVAGAVLRRVLHPAERSEVLADVTEEYAARSARAGRARARVWLWRQVVSSIPGGVRRGWMRGTTGFESEANRMSGGVSGLEGWIHDARFALRGLRTRPQYVLLSVLTLALGVGGTTAVFGIARALLLEPLPYAASEELVVFWNDGDWRESEFAYLRDDWSGFAGVAAYRPEAVFMRMEGAPSRLIPGVASSAELFDVLGAMPLLGQGFRPGDDLVGAEPKAVLSHGLWQELGGRRDIIGSTLRLDGQLRRVIGVMPAGFWFPDPSVRIWVSTPMRPDNNVGNYALVGRRAPGQPLTAMEEPLRRITTRLSEVFTYSPQWDKTQNAELTPVADYTLGPIRPALIATLAGMGVILLMACANVATLMLGQLRGRTSELAVRIALGAGRRRLTQQLLVESAMLGLFAGLIGALAAAAGFRLLLSALPLGELAHAVEADWTLFLTALLVAFGAALVIAMAPVFSLWRGDLREALMRARSGGIGARGGRLEEGLVVTEVALAVLLAASAAVLIRSVENLRTIDPGVETTGIGAINVTAADDLEVEPLRQHYVRTTEALAALPGVAAAGMIQRLPLRDHGDNWGITVLGQPADEEVTTTALRFVTRDYFDVMGIRVLRGRGFDATDRQGSELVIVIDETLAEEYFPGQDPIGQQIGSGTGTGWMRVIGVVEAVAHAGLTDEPEPGRYVLVDQHDYVPGSAVFVLRAESDRDVAPLLPQAVRRIQETTPDFAVDETTTMENVFALAMGPTHRIMQLMTMLGVLALALGAVGVYGVVSYFVSRRRRDWVIKIALGLRPATVLRQVVTRGALLVVLGCVLGLVASVALIRLFSSLLYGVSAADPAALLAAAATLVAAGCIAALLPGHRASRANPAQVLRES